MKTLQLLRAAVLSLVLFAQPTRGATPGVKDWASVSRDLSNWMSHVPDNTSLASLSLPGTHDTMTWEGAFNFADLSRCQTLSLTSQLDAGVRIVDIRLGNHGKDGLRLYHGKDVIRHSRVRSHVTPSGKTILDDHKYFQEDVLDECIDFLRGHGKESIIMLVNKHDKDAEGIGPVFEAKVKSNSAHFFTENRIPTLGEARKKIVLVRRYTDGPYKYGIDATGWGGNTEFKLPLLAVQDRYKEWNTGTKWARVQEFMTGAGDNRWSGSLVINYSSIAGGGFPVHDPEHFANIMNTKLNDCLEVRPGPSILGGLVMDYVTDELVSKVVRTNFKYSPSPTALLRWYKGNNCTQKYWNMTFNAWRSKTNLQQDPLYPNDEFRSVQLQNLKAGSVVTVYDDPYGKTSDDYTVIEVLKDIAGNYNINTLEKSRQDDKVKITAHRKNGLDGKISRVEFSKK